MNTPVAPKFESNSSLRRWPTAVVSGLILYYLVSIATLPFANSVWIGELPLLALVQIPKIHLKRYLQDIFISWLPALGLASGSASPDLILTHSWALGCMAAVPALLLLCLITSFRFVAGRENLITTFVVVACVDAAVTFWFDSTSRLSIF